MRCLAGFWRGKSLARLVVIPLLCGFAQGGVSGQESHADFAHSQILPIQNTAGPAYLQMKLEL